MAEPTGEPASGWIIHLVGPTPRAQREARMHSIFRENTHFLLFP
jgi:hypothetical protein